MPLILVIVADPHEAAQLAALIQGRLSVDLVQAAEVGEGLLALEDRIPDLILTSPLMSPFDGGVLDEYLRDLGPAGAHVQTLSIPVLSQAPKKAKRLGFSLRRRSKPETPTIDGCDPKVFADEIEQYLARAAEERRHAASNDQSAGVERVVADVAEPAIAEEQWTAAYSEDEPVVSSSWSAPEPEPEPEPVVWRADLLDRPPVEETPIYQPTPVAYDESPAEVESPVETASAVEVEEVEAVSTWQEEVVSEPAIEYVVEPTPIEEVIEPEAPVEPYIVASSIELTPAFEEAAPIEEVSAIEPVVEAPAPAIEASPEIEEAPISIAARTHAAPDVDENKATPSFKAALAAIRAAWGKPPRKTESSVSLPEPPAPVEPVPVVAAPETPDSFEVDLTDVVEVVDEEPIDADAQAAALSRHAGVEPVAEAVEVYELSVEPDLSELELQLVKPRASQRVPQAPAPAPAAPPVEERKAVESTPAPEADANGRKKGKRAAKGAKAKPARQGQAQPQSAQNEWGIFDPNQCGFAALVDKLDEVADKKTKQPQNGSKVRVISLS